MDNRSARSVFNFNTHWKWINRNISGGESQYLDEAAAGAKEICIPHSHAITGLTDLNPECFQYISWYRRHFCIPGIYAGKRISVEFQGTSQVATVYLNGFCIGEHIG
jgi:beta-galactosidase